MRIYIILFLVFGGLTTHFVPPLHAQNKKSNIILIEGKKYTIHLFHLLLPAQ